MPQMPDSFKPIDMPDSFQPIVTSNETTAEQPGLLTRGVNAVKDYYNESPILQRFLTGFSTSDKAELERRGVTNVQGPELMKIPGVESVTNKLEHAIDPTDSSFYSGVRPFAAGAVKLIGDTLASGLDPRAVAIKGSEAVAPKSLERPVPEVKPTVEVPKVNVDELQPSLPLTPELPPATEVVKPTPVSAANNLIKGMETAKPLITDQEVLASAEKSKRLAAAAGVKERGLEGFKQEKKLLAGKLPKIQFEPLNLSPEDVDTLMTTIRDHPSAYGFDKISAREGLEKIISGQVPQRSELKLLGNIFGEDFSNAAANLTPGGGKLQQWYDLPRGLMSVDPPFITSAAWRQGNSLVGTRNWFKGWASAMKGYTSKEASDAIEANIKNLPLFKPETLPDGSLGPSYAEKVGLRLGDLTKYYQRDEAIRGELAEKIPVYGKAVAASNRAFNSFMNTVSSGTFTDLIEDLKGMGKDPLNDIPLGRAAADFVNTALKRGKLGVEVGPYELNLERSAKTLANIGFSPRTYSSQIRMMNPSTYFTAPAGVRKQYLYALGRTLGVWGTIAGLSKFASDNVEVSTDRNSADFGKIRIGNTRIDLPGGMQQFIVLTNRMLPERLGGGGITSTTPRLGEKPKFTPFGQGYKPETRLSTLENFAANRLHPTLKLGYDFLNASESEPFRVGDRTLQALAPMFVDDVMQAYQEDPKAILPILVLSGIGVGTQSYERGSFGKPVFLPEEYDINIGAKELKR